MNPAIFGYLKLFFPVFLCAIVFGCTKNPAQNPSRIPNYIRVQNQMGRDLENVRVNTNSFGALKSEATSEYQMTDLVYENVSVLTVETNGYFRNNLFMGGRNSELPGGKYTYILKLNTNEDLEVNQKKD